MLHNLEPNERPAVGIAFVIGSGFVIATTVKWACMSCLAGSVPLVLAGGTLGASLVWSVKNIWWRPPPHHHQA